MENQKMHYWGISQYEEKQMTGVDNDYERKFRKIEDDSQLEQSDIAHALETYHDTIEKCECMNDNIFQVQKINSLAQSIQSPTPIRADDFQEPTKPHVKFKISIEKKPKLSKAQSSQQSIIAQRQNHHSEVKINIHRVSIDQSDKVKQNLFDLKEDIIRPQNHSIPQSSQYFASTDQINGEKPTTNKKLRMKSSSILSLSSSNGKQQKKFKKCIPLKQFHVKQKESFLQTAYRMRRLEQPNWSKNWASSDKLKKSNAKMTLKPKDKVVFETYDFDGELIPSFYALQKQRKYAGENPKVQFEFVNDISIQNKRKDNEKKQTKAKTIKQTKFFQYPELIPVESQFLKNFQDLRWSRSIEQKFSQLEYVQGKKKLQQQGWISDFEKIKYNGSQKNSYFQHSFSKYLKAKILHEKQSKQKSRSMQDGKHLKMLQQNQNQKEPSIHQPIRVLKKGSQKVRANKTLFQKIFNTSLKNIDPQCREDIATIKLINDTEKENIEALEEQKRQKLKSTRNTDTILFQEEFSLITLVKQSVEDSKTFFSKLSKSLQSKKNFDEKSQYQSQYLIKKDSTKQINPSPRKKYFGDETNNFVNGKCERQDLQKMFKKETKKVIFKHSLFGGNRQSFQ